eukprot:849142-Rhodomonas_salina.1
MSRTQASRGPVAESRVRLGVKDCQRLCRIQGQGSSVQDLGSFPAGPPCLFTQPHPSNTFTVNGARHGL